PAGAKPMNLTFTEEQRALRAEVAAFLDEERAAGSFTPAVDAWITGFDRAFTKKMAARGWIGLTWPEEYGGGGRTYVDRLCLTELLLAAGSPLAAHWFADRQMRPAILAGDVTYCIGMSEPQAGSDLAGVRTRGVRDGSGWRISGHKIWTSLAHLSDYIYVLARTDPASERHDGLSEFIVPLRSAGVTITPIHD